MSLAFNESVTEVTTTSALLQVNHSLQVSTFESAEKVQEYMVKMLGLLKALAQENKKLRNEIADLKQQLSQQAKQYQEKIDALSEKLKKIEDFMNVNSLLLRRIAQLEPKVSNHDHFSNAPNTSNPRYW